jgi:ADP-heptose:LPS heptosyltransferase
LDVPAAAHAEADAFIARAVGGPAPARLVALHPGGKGLRGQKRWRPERFAAVADALGAGWDACVLLLGGRDEQPLTREVAARMSRSPVLAAGHLSLLGTVALMARCDLFIGNDSSPLHLAACQGTPYVGIFGPTSLANFEPIPFRPSQGRLAVASPAPRRREYFVGARPIWYAPISPHAARAALDSISSDLVLGYANELLAKHAASTAAHEADMHPMVQDAGVS